MDRRAAVRHHRRRDGRHPDRHQARAEAGSPTSRSTRRPTGSAARGGRTPIPGSPATSRRTSTRYSFALNPGLEPPFSPGAEIQAYFERRRRGARRRAATSASATRSSRCEFDGGRWQLDDRAGSPRRGRRRHRRDRRAAPPARTPTSTGSTPSRGAMFHSARWDHGVPIDGARVGIIGTGSTAVQIVVGDRRRASRSSRCSSAPRSGSCRRTTPRTPTRSRREFRRRPGGAPRRCDDQLAEMFDLFANARGRRRLAGDAR